MTQGAAPLSPAPRAAKRVDPADLFRLMADCAPVMVWVADPRRKCVYFNRAWLEFTGRPLASEVDTGWLDGMHPDDRPRFQEAFARAFEACDAFEMEYRLRRHDGQFRRLLGKGVPLLAEGELHGYIGSCLDVTDRMAAEEAARKREKDFKALAENIPDVIARVDRELRILYVNPAVEQAFGARSEDLIGRRAADLDLPEEFARAAGEAIAAAFARDVEQRLDFQTDSPAGPRQFLGRVVPEIGEAGRSEAALLIAYDVTARAREDRERARMLEHERSARAEAESATLARDQFLAVVSHELRSPLNGIKSWTHVLENQLRDADPSIRRALAGIMIGVDHQVRLIDDLLDVTRALSGTLGLIKERMAVLPVLADAVESLRALALEKGLRLATDFSIGEREIHGDPDRVRQIFVNLLSNAVKFTRAGGHIWVNARAEDGMAVVEVRDDGVGIPQEFLPYLFDPFRQAEPAGTSRRQEGMGLGLALVQRLAELHGGHVACESRGPGCGATFRVRLPLQRDAIPRVLVGTAPREGASASSSLPSLAGIRVLLIDDQREARESLSVLLHQAGAEVAAAASGKEAVAHLDRGTEGLPDVIICDIAMPEEDGYATLKRIRRWEASHAATAGMRRPAVALSAYAQREDRIRALAEGFQMHLTKPVAQAELLLVVSSVARGMRL